MLNAMSTFAPSMPTHSVQRAALSLGRAAASKCADDDDDDAECYDDEGSLAPVHGRQVGVDVKLHLHRYTDGEHDEARELVGTQAS